MPLGYRSALACVAIPLALTTACQRAPAPPLTEVVVATIAAVPTEPNDAVWNQAPEFVAPLILQDLVEPRLMVVSTTQLRVRALSDGQQLAFRLEWSDDTHDDVNMPHTFSDACAVQLPAVIEPTVPAPQMGEPGRPVEITYWNANWQATVNGRGDSLRDVYPNAAVDHYPFQSPALEPDSPEQQAMAARFAPARALGNLMAGPRQTAVQQLVAEGPGSLHPASEPLARGSGRRTPGGWSVVLTRTSPKSLSAQPAAQVAFAVWQGSRHEIGSRKMRTGWITLAKQEKS